ncbi:unnamed protein product [Amoebophrya sp. A120]|nr:unnamed protein product [Amoebophrya sp. A120]|eukprot:GSA120T00024960001.1
MPELPAPAVDPHFLAAPGAAANVAEDEKAKLPPMKRQKREKTPAAEAAKAEKKRLQDEEKVRKKQEKEAEKVARNQAIADEKMEKARLKKFDKELGDKIKDYVQGRSTQLEYSMDDAEFNYMFSQFLPTCQYEKKITTEKTFGDGRVERTVETVEKALYLSAHQVSAIFGCSKVRGGTYGRFHGATTWNITSMVVKRLSPNRVRITWKLSGAADF